MIYFGKKNHAKQEILQNNSVNTLTKNNIKRTLKLICSLWPFCRKKIMVSQTWAILAFVLTSWVFFH